MRGETLAILAAVLWGFAPILDKFAISGGISIYAANVVRVIGALMAILVASLLTTQLDFSGIDVRKVAYLLAAGAIAGAIAMVLYYSALRSLGASKTVSLTAIYPMFTMIFWIFSIILLGEEVSLKLVVGTVLIIVGIILVSEV